MKTPAFRSGRDFVARLRSDEPLWAIELRPPRRAATRSAGVEPWIDMYHAVRRLTTRNNLVLTTDNALGDREEENLRHLHANLGNDADLTRVVPFLTTKHPLEYCLRFSERALLAGHRATVVLGGDRHDGVPRCVEHASELRTLLRQRNPGAALGGWANPHREPAWQVELLKQEERSTDFFLTQVVSHHDLAPLERFLREADKHELDMPAVVGVFYYRSGNPKTLRALSRFMPVPEAALREEFGREGLDAVSVCLRTLRAVRKLGVRHIYLCNLSPTNAAPRLEAIKELMGEQTSSPAGTS